MTNPFSDPRARETALVVLGKLLQVENPDVGRACLRLLAEVSDGGLVALTWHQLARRLDEWELGVPTEDVWDQLTSTKLFVEDGRRLVPLSEIRVGELFSEVSPRDDRSVRVADLACLTEEAPVPAELGEVSPRKLVDTVHRVQHWAADCLKYGASEELAGFPVFWECAEGEHWPFGTDFGSGALADTLLLWLEGSYRGLPPPVPSDATAAAVKRAWSHLIGFRGELGSWYDGAIVVPYFDDDFVGSFTLEHASRGACPTTDTSADRLYALASLAGLKDVIPLSADLAEQSRVEVAAAARLLLRWQEPGGAWAIHRYQPESNISAPIRDLSCRYAVEALVAGLTAGFLDEGIATEIRQALERFAGFALASAVHSGAESWWEGDFIAGDDGARLRATTMMGLILGPLEEALGDSRLSTLQGRAVRFLVERWRPELRDSLVAEFRVPTWSGLSLSTFTWELPANPLIASAVLDWRGRGGELDGETQTKLERSADLIMEAENHGHWLDPLLGKPFTSNSLQYLRGLLALYRWKTARDVEHP